MSTKSIMIVGVGGQGTLLASRIIGNALISQGYEVDDAEDGSRAIELMDNETYDVILTDFKMPMVSGMDVLKRFLVNARNTDNFNESVMRQLKTIRDIADFHDDITILSVTV